MFNNEEAEFQAKSEPLVQWKKNDAVGHNYIVEEIVEKIRQEMLSDETVDFQLSWISVEKDGTVKANTINDREKIITVNAAEVNMSPEGGVKLFERLSQQIYIGADYVGHSDFPMVEMSVGSARDDGENTALIAFPLQLETE